MTNILITPAIVALLLSVSGAAFAQQSADDGKAPDSPAGSQTGAPVDSGAAPPEGKPAEERTTGSPGSGSCDSLTGPEKKACLRKGGSVTTSTDAPNSRQSSSGSSKPPASGSAGR